MKKEDFSLVRSVLVDSFDEIEEYGYVFVVGIKNNECFIDDIMDDWTGEKMVNTKDVELFSSEEQKKYYDKEFDFYFIFDEEDERREFIDENELKVKDL